jgi:hypothetical protein
MELLILSLYSALTLNRMKKICSPYPFAFGNVMKMTSLEENLLSQGVITCLKD